MAEYRSRPAQLGPPVSLDGLPVNKPTGHHWHREHGHRDLAPDKGCWYFASLPADPAAGGRFDLPAPDGTCYFANKPRVAALERVGRFTAQHKPVPADLVAARIVTSVATSTLPAKAANLTAARAATHFGVTGELFTTPDYTIGQAWAAAVHDHRHEALTYTPRFSPGERAIAVFGPSGPNPRPVQSVQPLGQVLQAARIPVIDIPPSTGLTFAFPPTKP